jgi:hypothetical protein
MTGVYTWFMLIHTHTHMQVSKSKSNFVSFTCGNGRTCSTYGERRRAYRALVGKPERRRPIGRPTRRWEDNISVDLQEVGWGGV